MNVLEHLKENYKKYSSSTIKQQNIENKESKIREGLEFLEKQVHERYRLLDFLTKQMTDHTMNNILVDLKEKGESSFKEDTPLQFKPSAEYVPSQYKYRECFITMGEFVASTLKLQTEHGFNFYEKCETHSLNGHQVRVMEDISTFLKLQGFNVWNVDGKYYVKI